MQRIEKKIEGGSGAGPKINAKGRFRRISDSTPTQRVVYVRMGAGGLLKTGANQ